MSQQQQEQVGTGAAPYSPTAPGLPPEHEGAGFQEQIEGGGNPPPNSIKKQLQQTIVVATAQGCLSDIAKAFYVTTESHC